MVELEEEGEEDGFSVLMDTCFNRFVFAVEEIQFSPRLG